MRVRFIYIMVLLLCPCMIVSAQKISVSTDLSDYAALGTLNAEVSVAVSRHWSLEVEAKYNPFRFRKDDLERQFQLCQQSYSVGARFWPWHIWTGWWFASGIRYQEYNWGGILSRKTQEGDRWGVGLYSGYTLMLSAHLNMEFGLGLWGGVDMYRKYDCPVCGLTEKTGRKGFVLPDGVKIAVAYVF